MRDWKIERLRYLVHFGDGGSGMRYFDAPLDVGAELSDGGRRYVVERGRAASEPERARARVGADDRAVALSDVVGAGRIRGQHWGQHHPRIRDITDTPDPAGMRVSASLPE